MGVSIEMLAGVGEGGCLRLFLGNNLGVFARFTPEKRELGLGCSGKFFVENPGSRENFGCICWRRCSVDCMGGG